MPSSSSTAHILLIEPYRPLCQACEWLFYSSLKDLLSLDVDSVESLEQVCAEVAVRADVVIVDPVSVGASLSAVEALIPDTPLIAHSIRRPQELPERVRWVPKGDGPRLEASVAEVLQAAA